jgi:RNA polymerase sigma factor (TIGR02999 family)
MSSDRPQAVSRLLEQLRDGHHEAIDELFPLIYEELRELARRQRKEWLGNDTLNTTALVHEAYLKLGGQRRAKWETEAHFLAAAAKAMRHLLINYARDRRARKRGGGWQRVSLSDTKLGGLLESAGPSWEDRVLALHEALQRLAERSERQSRIVECRFFGSMSVQQTAAALGLSTATVTRGWALARAWLYRELSGNSVRG